MSTANNIANATSISGIMDAIDLGPTDSIQFTFAKLQLAQAQLCKDKANDYMKKIEGVQAEQKKCAEMLQLARSCQVKAKNNQDNGNKSKSGKTVGDGCCSMPEELIQFMDKNGLTYPNSDKDWILGGEEWDVAIQSLTTYQESISNKTQTMMVYLQDYINQYNSYTQGASSAIAKGSEVLTTVATGR